MEVERELEPKMAEYSGTERGNRTGKQPGKQALVLLSRFFPGFPGFFRFPSSAIGSSFRHFVLLYPKPVIPPSSFRSASLAARPRVRVTIFDVARDRLPLSFLGRLLLVPVCLIALLTFLCSDLRGACLPHVDLRTHSPGAPARPLHLALTRP